jgi:hypothetical protein
MSEDYIQYGKAKRKSPSETKPDKPTKTRFLSASEREKLKEIADKAVKLRKEKYSSYEAFALKAQINRNTYFRFEKEGTKGENFTVAILLRILKAHNIKLSVFFKDLD